MVSMIECGRTDAIGLSEWFLSEKGRFRPVIFGEDLRKPRGIQGVRSPVFQAR